MKKFLPLILLGAGILVAVLAFVLVKGRDKEGNGSDVDEIAPEIELKDRPVASLTPSEDGHWLKLNIEKIVIKGAQSMDYELLYKVGDGRTQGVPGTIKLEGQDSIERDLLLGSESAGKFKYDEGVETGTLTLRFRNQKGKLIGKFVTEFRLQSQDEALESVDGAFKLTMDGVQGGYFVTMETFGVPEDVKGNLETGPYGVFSSIESAIGGKVEMNGSMLYLWDDNWDELKGGSTSKLGIFVGTSGNRIKVPDKVY